MPTQQKRKQRKIIYASIIYRIARIWFILLCAPIIAARTPIELVPVKPTGIIFEDVGRAITYRQHWTMLTQIKFPQWNNTLDFVQTCAKTLESLCSGINYGPGETNCKHWKREVNLRILKIKEKISEINIYTQCKKPRTKRGLINLGGSVAKFLFGTMDHEDSEKIYSKLEELEHTTQKSINIAHQQLTLIKTNTEIMGNSLLNLSSQYNTLIDRTKRFDNFVEESLKNATTEVKLVHVMAEMNEVALFMINELQKISDQLTTTFFVLESIQQQELSPLMLPAKEFKSLYETIISNRPDLESDFSLVKVVVKTYSQCLDNRILIKILIPILESPYFSVNRVYLIPTPLTDGIFSIFDNMPDYLFHSTFLQKNFELSETNFKSSCTSVNTTLFICEVTGPIRTTPKEGDCVQSLFRNPSSEPPACTHRILKHFDNVLVPMKHENAWLYWSHVKIPLYCQCPDGLFTEQLNGVGIFRLLRPCIFRFSEFIIPFKNNALYNLTLIQPEIIEIPKLDQYKPVLETKINNSDVRTLKILEPSSLHAVLQTSGKTIENLQSELDQLEANRSNSYLHTKFDILSITFGSILLLSLFIFIIKIFKRNDQSNNPNNASTTRRRVEIKNISHPIIIPRRNQLIDTDQSHYLEPVHSSK